MSKKINYNDTKKIIEKMLNENYMNFVKSLISCELKINDEDLLDKIYNIFIDVDTNELLSEDFKEILKDLDLKYNT